MGPLTVTKRRAGSVLIVRVEGELDLHTAPRFRQEVDGELEASPGLRHLVLVLGGLSFVDSSGVGALLGRYRQVHQRGGQVVAVGPGPQVRRVLERAGFLRLVQVCASEEQALQRIR